MVVGFIVPGSDCAVLPGMLCDRQRFPAFSFGTDHTDAVRRGYSIVDGLSRDSILDCDVTHLANPPTFEDTTFEDNKRSRKVATKRAQ